MAFGPSKVVEIQFFHFFLPFPDFGSECSCLVFDSNVFFHVLGLTASIVYLLPFSFLLLGRPWWLLAALIDRRVLGVRPEFCSCGSGNAVKERTLVGRNRMKLNKNRPARAKSNGGYGAKSGRFRFGESGLS